MHDGYRRTTTSQAREDVLAYKIMTIACTDQRLLYQILTTWLIHFSLKGWEEVLFELGSEKVKIMVMDLLQIESDSTQSYCRCKSRHSRPYRWRWCCSGGCKGRRFPGGSTGTRRCGRARYPSPWTGTGWPGARTKPKQTSSQDGTRIEIPPAVALAFEGMRTPYASGREICVQKFGKGYQRKEAEKRMTHFKSTFSTIKFIKRFSEIKCSSQKVPAFL